MGLASSICRNNVFGDVRLQAGVGRDVGLSAEDATRQPRASWIPIPVGI
jgi:hypothetical protein